MTRKRSKDAPADAGRITHEVVPLAAVDPSDRNYNVHDAEQIDALTRSLRRFGGQVRSAVVWRRPDGRYTMVAGHGLMEAAGREGLTELRADVIPSDWSPADVDAYLIADNELAKRSRPDETALASLLEEQRAAGFDLRALGSSEDELAALHERLAQAVLRAGGDEEDEDGEGGGGPAERARYGDDEPDPDGAAGDDEAEDPGAWLERLDLTLHTPRHVARVGEVWQLGAHHTLVVADVFLDWPAWEPWLARAVMDARDDAPKPRPVVFAPFAGPLVALSERAEKRVRLVLVQPDVTIAAHALDYYAEVHGERAVTRISEGVADGEG